MATPLNSSTLGDLATRMPVPTYDRRVVTPGIVHIGVGGFHRSHQAMYVDRLLEAGGSSQWGICGVGVMPADRGIHEALRVQEGLYTLVEKNPDGRHSARVIGSIVEHLHLPSNPRAVVEQLANPRTQMVTLTITEGGYGLNGSSGHPDPEALGSATELAPGAYPTSAFGLLARALSRRLEERAAPFTVVSCDNLPGNGALTRAALVGFTRLADPELADWIDNEVTFPNSMVDRITPATTDADREALRSQFGVDDHWPVVCEPFAQWVLEDEFSGTRPPLEEVGVQIVSSVEPYELMKLRLLNGGHQALAYFASLCGHVYVDEAATDPLLGYFVRCYLHNEAQPTLPDVPGVDLGQYRDTLFERFGNVEIRDTVARLCADTSDRIPKFVLPAIKAQLETGGPILRGAAIVASWARYLEGADDQGRPITVVDRRRDELLARAALHDRDPLALIENRELFGHLPDNRRFVDAYSAVLTMLRARGTRPTLLAIAKGALT